MTKREKAFAEVYNILRSKGHDDAALVIADLVINSPEAWMRDNVTEDSNKLDMIKEARNRFGITLKEALNAWNNGVGEEANDSQPKAED